MIFTGHSKAVTCLTALREDGSNLILSGAKVNRSRTYLPIPPRGFCARSVRCRADLLSCCC